MLDPIIYPLSIDTFVPAVEYLTAITEVGNQREYRIARGDDGLIYFNAIHGVRSIKDFRALMSFHRRRKGRARAFLVRDQLDYQADGSTDTGLMAFGTGDGATTEFQLTKTYSDLYNSEVRTVTKAEHGFLKIYVNSVLQVEGTDYDIKNGWQGKNSGGANYLCTVDGIVKFKAGHVPAGAAVIEWAGRFLVPVRFMEDRLPSDEIAAWMIPDPSNSNEWIMKEGAAGNLPPVMMREVRET
jgi:uncharacterized protein (TIGR02217 family)